LSIAKFEEAKLRDDFQKAKTMTVHHKVTGRGSIDSQGLMEASSSLVRHPSHHRSVMCVPRLKESVPSKEERSQLSPGQSGAASKHAHHVTSEPSTTQGRVADLCKELQAAEIDEAMKEETTTMHVLKPHVTVNGTTDEPALGPTIYINVLLEGQPVKALVDVQDHLSVECINKMLIRCFGETPAEGS